MRNLLLVAMGLVATASAAGAEDGRFFLFIAGEPPEAALVRTAYESAGASGLTTAARARERIGAVFVRLFGAGLARDRSALDAELKLARASYFRGHYGDSEAAFERALAIAEAEPELLADDALAQRLVDGAARRYRNTIARKRPKGEAHAQIARFLDRYPRAAPTASDHAPEILAAWNRVRAEHQQGYGSIVVNVVPLELERGGACKLYLNGMLAAGLPQPGPLPVPRGSHQIQVRCGLQVSWLQRVEVGAASRALQVPVRAMLAARGDAATGGVVLVAPSEGDGAALVHAIAQSTDMRGAVVALASESRVELGTWDRGADGPRASHIGRRVGSYGLEGVEARRGASGGDSSRVWTWVVGGLGLATLGGAVVTNVVTADKIRAGDSDTQGLQTATIALYAAGGALVATSIVLFFVEGDGEDGEEAALSASPGGLVMRF